MMTILPEFQQVEGKNAFVKNHPVPPFEKDVWKKTLTPIEQWGHYEAAYTKSLGLIDELNASLVELDSLVHCPEFCTEGTTLYLFVCYIYIYVCVCVCVCVCV
jgi:glutaredoxin 2